MRTVGKLAKETGITVRTLHHYDSLGLVSPSVRSAKGYRLYGAEDVTRLHAVRSLQEAGFSLKAIGDMMTRPDFSVREAIKMQASMLKQKLRLQQDLSDKLDHMLALLGERKQVPLEDVIHVLTSMNQVQKMGLDPEDEKKLEAHWAKLSAADIKAVEAEWPKLIAQVREHMQRGTDPKDPAVQELAKRWMELVQMFTGNIPAMNDRVKKQWDEHGDDIRAKHGSAAPDTEMFAYVRKALA